MSGSLPPRQHAYNGQHMVPGAVPMAYGLGASQMPPTMNGQYRPTGPLPSPQFFGQPPPPPPPPQPHMQLNAHQQASHLAGLNAFPQPHLQHSHAPHNPHMHAMQHAQHAQHAQPSQYQQLPHLPQHAPLPQHAQPHLQQHAPQQRFQPQQTPPQQYMAFPGQRSHSPMVPPTNGAFQYQHNGASVSGAMPSPIAMPAATPSPIPAALPSPMPFMSPQMSPMPPMPQVQVQQRFSQPQATLPSKPLNMYPNASPTPPPQRIPQPAPQHHPYHQPPHQLPHQQPQPYLSHQMHASPVPSMSPKVVQHAQPPKASPPIPQYPQPVVKIPVAKVAIQQHYKQPQQPQQHPKQEQPHDQEQLFKQEYQFEQGMLYQQPQAQPQPGPPRQRQQVPPSTPQHVSSSLPKASPRISHKGAIQKSFNSPRKASIGGIVASPKTVPKRSPTDTASLLVCVADDCFSKAQSAAPALAKSRDESQLHDYYKLMATGLGCLDGALRAGKFSPRVEVKIRIRYASILSEETENLMEAETTLQTAIATCEKHRLADLRLYVQFLFMKVLFRRKPKAALISIESHITDCSSRKHTYWTYAFRFLKAFFYLQTGNPADTHALENLHAITTLAEQRGDRAVYVLASLLQALALFRTTDKNVVEKVRSCMAAASKYQLDKSVHIPQLDVMWHLLDLSCSFSLKEKAVTDKMNAMQSRLEELKDSPLWAADSAELSLPLRKDSSGSALTISPDTGDVLRPGDDCDFLVLTSFSKVNAFILGFTFSGLTLASRQQATDRRSMDYWEEALKMIAQSEKTKSSACIFLHEAANTSRWRATISSYILVLIGLNAATHCDWSKVQDCTRQLEAHVAEANDGPLEVLALYLRGVLRQGTGELQDALDIFGDPLFALEPDVKAASGEGQVKQEIALLAAMNRLMIMQLDRLRDEEKINNLVEQLERLCMKHSNPEVVTAYNLVMAAIHTQPPLSIHEIKTHIQCGLNGSTTSGNAQCLNIALNTMRHRLFENVVGDQALKSAKAGSTQAKKSGNILWMSVADGMLADTYEVQGQTDQAQKMRQAGIRYANETWESTQV